MPFSTRRGLLHAGLAVAIMIAVIAVIVATRHVADPEKLGEGVGRFALFGFGGAFGLSYLVQTGRRRAALAAFACVVALIGAVVAVVLTAGGSRAIRLTAAERAPLEVVTIGGVTWLRQPALGFELRHPGPAFTRAPASAMASAFPPELDTSGDGYLDPASGAALVVAVMSAPPASRTDFEAMIEGIRTGLEASLRSAGAAPMQTVRDDVRWHDGVGEVHQHRQDATGQVHVHVDVWQDRFGGAPRVVMVMALSSDGDSLAPVVASFRRR